MRPFDYAAPTSAQEAVALLSEHGDQAKVLAGGTDLIVDLKHDPGNVSLLVDVTEIPEFLGIEETDEGLRIGSMAKYGEIMAESFMDLYSRYVKQCIDRIFEGDVGGDEPVEPLRFITPRTNLNLVTQLCSLIDSMLPE